MSKTRTATIVLLVVILAAMITTSLLRATTGTSHSTLLGRGTFERVKVERETETAGREFEVEVKAKPSMDVATQIITFQPGEHSGWHSHPGPVFITVMSGTMTFYDSGDPGCSPVVRTAVQGFLDVGEHAHIARNETDNPAINVVTYFVPVGAALRIDQPQPNNCPPF
jgi:hypothetical protein